MNAKRAVLAAVRFAGTAFGQGQVPPVLPNNYVTGNSFAKIANVSCVLPNLFYNPSPNNVPPSVVDPTPNARGITLLGAGATNPAVGGHTHHFADFQNYSQNLLSLNVSIATQLTSLPIPSPASGFIFTFDRTAGVHVPNPRTLGSILTERAETIGAKRFFSAQRTSDFALAISTTKACVDCQEFSPMRQAQPSGLPDRTLSRRGPTWI